MEEIQIKIECTASEEQLCEIIKTNTPEDVAKAFREYMNKQTHDWYSEKSRADKAEDDIREIDKTLANAFLNQLKKGNELG